MKLSEILKNVVTEEFDEQEILSVCFDSQSVEKNSMFFCLKGENRNGEDFVLQAIEKGAVCVVSERKLDIPVRNVVVKDVREALSLCSANFYGNPQTGLKIIGVVGTNGKTSTTKIIQAILCEAMIPCATIGTLGVNFDGKNYSSKLTTPDPTELYKHFSDLKKLGAKVVAMEVSAHAIALKKVCGIKFDTLVFTNCTQDHLDYFKDFETYKSVKKSIFNKNLAENIIVNTDDPLGVEILNEVEGVTSYAIKNPADVFAVNQRVGISGTSFVINIFDEIYDVKTKLVGAFNIYNILASMTAARLMGVSLEVMVKAVKKLQPISGRMEKVAVYNGGCVFVDYAHTPDGLEKALISLRKVTKNNLYLVFGCGGNRDSSKRQIMGRIAGDLADFSVITSDNPRFEDSYKIISQIECGLRESSLDYICIENRKKAIIYGLKLLGVGDNLLIAGKGSENYQEIMGVFHEFSDKGVVLEYIDG
ncbi:MAG: UDP-N-acetylmuramoyl-L-alanyl-D-glutamate--2,6-diaminopimelate ligase [Christensenellaceae bacterium]